LVSQFHNVSESEQWRFTVFLHGNIVFLPGNHFPAQFVSIAPSGPAALCQPKKVLSVLANTCR
jgi:hypothetical protein